MPSSVRPFRSIALALLLGFSLPAQAAPVTMNSITVDVPDSFKASPYDRGMETKTADEEVFVWFETYLKDEADTLIGEHKKYWNENDVAFASDATEKTSKSNNVEIRFLDFKDATWKGKPTVVRYLQIGPLGKQDEFVLVTVWASPDGIAKYGKAVDKMVDSMNVAIKN